MARILFVCTGNTCRSPMAEVLAQNEMRKRDLAFEVRSAGVSTLEGAGASESARLVVREHGLDLDRHQASRLDDEASREADLILALGRAHVDYVGVLSPEARSKVHLLREYATYGKEQGDVRDPLGGDLDTYRAVFEEIYELVLKAIQRLAKEGIGTRQA